MQTRKFDELISYFNRNVSNMDIDQKYKIELLGMITAIGFAHEKELHDPTIEPQRKKGKWIKYEQEFMLEGQLDTVQKTVMECSICTRKISGMVGFMNFCPNCGADMMREGEK